MAEPTRQLAAILFSDIVGYTALMGEDSNKALEWVRQAQSFQKKLVEQHNGIWLKEMGDGAMAQFGTALDAVNCAVEIQRHSRADFEGDLRIGIHLGDITVEDGDIFGDGVNVASRLESIADPGGIYVSDAIEKAIKGQTEIQAKYLGEIGLKNVEYGVRTYALQGVGLPVPESKDELSGHFVAELNRRGVFRSTLAYVGLGVLMYTALPLLASLIALPQWAYPVLVALLTVGLPISVYLSWTYEWSPQGFVRTTSAKSWQNPYSAAARKPLTGNVLIGVIWVGALVLIFYPKRSPQAEVAIPEDKSIAVLAFDDLSPEGNQEYFSDGISEEIINALVQVPGLKVSGRTSSFSFKGKDETAQSMGQQLGVSTILEGSVRKSGDQLRITAQLINTEDGFHIWSRTYNRELTDIFVVQDEITNSIVEALKVHLEGQSDLNRVAADTDLSVYEVYLQARQFLALRGQYLTEARRLFERVVEMDSTYSRGYSGLARTMSLIPTWQILPYETFVNGAKAAAHKAIELDSTNAEAYSVLGYLLTMHEWKWIEGEEYLLKSVNLRPNDPEVLNFLGDFYMATIHPEAVETEMRALELDPLHPVKYLDASIAYLNLNNYEKVLDLTNRAVEMGLKGAPQLPWVRAYPLIAYNRIADLETLLTEYEQVMGSEGKNTLAIRAVLEHERGNVDEMEQALSLLEALYEEDKVKSGLLSRVFVTTEKWEKAAEYLEKAYASNDPQMARGFYWIPLPERMPEHADLQAALDKPEWNVLWQIRRRNLGLVDE